MPEITLPLETYDTMRKRIDALEAELLATRETLRSSHERGAEMEIAAVRAILPAIDFALANLDPSGVVRGWAAPISAKDAGTPADGLELFGKLLGTAPWAAADDRALGDSYVTFAAEARAAALMKPTRRGTPPGPRAAVEDFGPQTEEARQVHEARIARENS
jgi:hypothetical protein